jgi:hypothetical protein
MAGSGLRANVAGNTGAARVAVNDWGLFSGKLPATRTNNSIAEVSRIRLSWEAAPQPGVLRPDAGIE